jgi:hypothetical protein
MFTGSKKGQPHPRREGAGSQEVRPDGSVWTGTDWTLVDPPGTHAAELLALERYARVMDYAWGAARAKELAEVTAERLIDLAQGDIQVLHDAADVLRGKRERLAPRAAELISLSIQMLSERT